MRLAAAPPVITRPERTIHFCTDIHSGINATVRTDKLHDDSLLAIRSAPVLRVHGGDVTNEDPANSSLNTVAFDNAAAAFITGFPDGAPYAVGVGNHDMISSSRTCAQYCAGLTAGGVVGLSGKTDVNQVFSLGGWGKAIVIGDSTMPNITFTQATLDWLEAQLVANAAYPCLVFGHAPLKGIFGSVNPADSTNVPSSTDANYVSKRVGDADDSYIRTLLGNHANAKAWISGHCHPHPTFTVDGSSKQTCAVQLTLGGRQVAHIIGGAGYYTHPFVDFFDPVYSTYITYNGGLAGGTIEVRHRDAQPRAWVPCDGKLVTILTVG